MPNIIRKMPEARLVIVGDGPIRILLNARFALE
jgi:hypothetical protein